MPILTRDLITRSFYLSGIVSRNLQTVEGDKINDGLEILNEMLAFKSADERKIPYFDIYNFDAVIGQETYFIPNLIIPQTLTFTLGTVRYAMNLVQRKEYLGYPRVNQINSLPFMYYIEKKLGGSNLSMYFLPNETYPFTLSGKFSLSNVTLDQDLSLSLDQFYIEYLRYLLASYLCDFYEIDMPMSAARRLMQYEKMMTDYSPFDFSIQKMSTLSSKRKIGFYGMANIGLGWVP